MDFYLIPQKGERLHLPVNPSGFRVSRKGLIETLDIMRIGEVDFWAGLGRTEVEFESFFPAQYDTYCRYTDIAPPLQYFKQLETMWKSGQPVRLLITKSPVNIMALIVEQPYEDKAGEPGDIYYKIRLRQWTEVGVKQSANANLAPSAAPVVKKENKQRPRQDTKAKKKVYTVKQGDNVRSIAKKELGDSSKSKQIYNMNNMRVGVMVINGQRLVLPDV